LEEDQQKQICRGLGYSLLRQDEQSPDRRARSGGGTSQIIIITACGWKDILEAFLSANLKNKSPFWKAVELEREVVNLGASKKFSWGWSSHSVLD